MEGKTQVFRYLLINFNQYQLKNQQPKISLLIEQLRSKIKIILKLNRMSQRTVSPVSKCNRMISKGGLGWKKFNKLAHRLRNKGVPCSIVDIIEAMPTIKPSALSLIQFQQSVGVREMSALAKMQSIQVLQMNFKHQSHMSLKRKQTQETQSGQNTLVCGKQNMGETASYDSPRPQQAEAVFS